MTQKKRKTPYVVERVEDEKTLCCTDRFQRRAVCRLKDHRQLALAFHVAVEVRRQKRASAKRLARNDPIGAQTNQELIAKRADLCVRWFVDAHPLFTSAHKRLIRKERRAALDEIVVAPMITHVRGGGGNIVHGTFENRFRVGE